MASKCPSCNKFCGLELQEPEVNSIEVEQSDSFSNGDKELQLTWDVRIVRTSECCGDEIKDASFNDSVSLVYSGHDGDGHDMSYEDGGCDPVEEGGGRYAKSYFGFEATGKIVCSCGEPVVFTSGDSRVTVADDGEVTIIEKIAASEMDELV